MKNIDLLKEICKTPGAPGFEQKVRGGRRFKNMKIMLDIFQLQMKSKNKKGLRFTY